MKVIRARNVQQILPEAMYQLLHVKHTARDSRNGPVLMFDEPVTSVYERPAERVMFWAQRDCNPFFHLIESLWMLAGLNSVEPMAQIVENMRSYSDDGVTFHGAYGYRWRYWFGFDQLALIIENLRANPDCRRQVLSMWDARSDLRRHDENPVPKDLPCNLQAIFQVAPDGRLDMMVTNRSNDMVWGAYGANAVHFSVLHEYMARAIGVEQGIYRQVSANFHTYQNILGKVEELAEMSRDPDVPQDLWAFDPYQNGLVKPYPLINGSLEEWHRDLEMLWTEPEAVGFKDSFFRRVAMPMALAHAAFKNKEDPNRFDTALAILEGVKATDWKQAAVEWIMRRRANWEENQRQLREQKAQDDGVIYD